MSGKCANAHFFYLCLYSFVKYCHSPNFYIYSIKSYITETVFQNIPLYLQTEEYRINKNY